MRIFITVIMRVVVSLAVALVSRRDLSPVIKNKTALKSVPSYLEFRGLFSKSVSLTTLYNVRYKSLYNSLSIFRHKRQTFGILFSAKPIFNSALRLTRDFNEIFNTCKRVFGLD